MKVENEVLIQGGIAVITMYFLGKIIIEIVTLLKPKNNKPDVPKDVKYSQPMMSECIAFHVEIKQMMKDTNKCAKQILEITTKNWEVHNKYDEDGAPKWYTTKVVKLLEGRAKLFERIEQRLDDIEKHWP
jgi:hypothetical protein